MESTCPGGEVNASSSKCMHWGLFKLDTCHAGPIVGGGWVTSPAHGKVTSHLHLAAQKSQPQLLTPPTPEPDVHGATGLTAWSDTGWEGRARVRQPSPFTDDKRVRADHFPSCGQKEHRASNVLTELQGWRRSLKGFPSGVFLDIRRLSPRPPASLLPPRRPPGFWSSGALCPPQCSAPFLPAAVGVI